MDAVVGLAAVGVASSGAAGYLVARLATVRHERLRRTWALAAEGGRGVAHPGLAWRLRHGVSGLRPVAEALLRREPVRRYVLWARMALEQRGYASTSDALLSLVLGACLALLVAGWVVAASPVFGAAVAGCALVALCAAVKNDAERREAALRDEIPDALRSLGVCFRAGLSLMQTLEQTASEMKGPLGELFLSAALVLQTGGTASEALALFRQRTDVPELAFVAVALDVQHQSGGSLAAVLDAARESVESEIDLCSLSQGADGPGPAVGAHRHGDAVRAYRPVLAYEPRFPLAVLREHGGYGSSGGGSGHAGGRRRLGASDAGRGRRRS